LRLRWDALPRVPADEREKRRSTRYSVWAGAPSGGRNPDGHAAALVAAERRINQSAVVADVPWTMARYSFRTARDSQSLPSSPAVREFLAMRTTPPVRGQAVDEIRLKAKG